MVQLWTTVTIYLRTILKIDKEDFNFDKKNQLYPTFSPLISFKSLTRKVVNLALMLVTYISKQ